MADITHWYNSYPDLTKDQIISTWNEKEEGKLNDNFEAAYFLKLVKLRSIRESFAIMKIKEMDTEKEEQEIPEMFSYNVWKNICEKLDKKAKAKKC
jgi:hypothetical protein